MVFTHFQVTLDNSASHQNGQQQDMQIQLQDNDEAGAFLQPTFINILNELSAAIERVLLPKSAQIEADTKV